MLCTECIDISYDSRVSQMVECVVNDNSARAAGVENIEVSISDTGATEVRSGEGTSMERGCIDGLVLAPSPLVDDPIIS